MAQTPQAFASFEQKWLHANPEQAVVAAFLGAQTRRLAAAFGCLTFELEQAAFNVREPQVAEVKLAWWRQELIGAAAGNPRHPISEVLFADARAVDVPTHHWLALADGALAMRNTQPALSLDRVLAEYAALYTPVVTIEAILAGTSCSNPTAPSAWAAVSHLLRALRHLPDPDERLAVPLDLLARHEITRSELAISSARRDALLRDYLGQLAIAFQSTLDRAVVGTLARKVRARLDRDLVVAAKTASQPLQRLLQPPAAARWKALYWSWREARALSGQK